ncbi:MAG: SUMF1/EgtB/PvdO family nonheme iron enzyme [Bdellovibrionota bacterium]|nr:SUMF1/EgtB/PvdO family nonheme iron enzyme [Bdellovibrionota bacterium]
MKVKLDISPFEKKEINKMSHREAMGLPEYYKNGRVDQKKLEAAIKSLSGLKENVLAEIIESKEKDFYDRYAAGIILSTSGDPRINCYEPQMIQINTKDKVIIGLSKNKVSEVYEKYKKIGVIEEWIQKETPEVSATILPFKIAKYPVTNLEYLEFLTDTLYPELPTSWEFGIFPSSKANCPVYTVSCEAADTYCLWLSKKTGRSFRLPSEFEWEFAAAGPLKNVFPWGNQFHPDVTNTVESGLFQSSPVGLFPKGASYFGVMDMGGNVEEYVSNDYFPYGEETIQDDLSSTLGQYRVARGGSFTRFEDLARCSRRHGRFPSDIYVMGFRVAEG